MPTLNWIGKEKVINHHQDVPYRVLEHKYGFIADASMGSATSTGSATGQNKETQSGNKIIHGDNLEALKSLLPEYEGKIKCIYIDPPYNTGNEKWVYNDNVNHPKIKKWLGEVVGKDGEDLSRHDKWLCMMYPRLKLLHKLLADDGAIFISIDDNEQANLKLICDEIFGVRNFLTSFIWKKKQGGGNDSKNIVVEHEYIYCYSRNSNIVNFKLDKNYKLDPKLYPFNDKIGEYGLVTLDKSSIRFSETLVFEIEDKEGNKYLPRIIKGKQSCWRWSKKKVEDQFSDLVFKNGKVYTKYRKPEGVTPRSLLTDIRFGRTEVGNEQLKNIFNSKMFDYPKPVNLVYHFFSIFSDKNSIILDSFAGSGTTAHAVLNLNKQDGGNRKFILIEMEDYANDITAERIKRVMQGYGASATSATSTTSTGSAAGAAGGSAASATSTGSAAGGSATEPKIKGTGGAFDFYELGLPLFNEDKNLNEEVGLPKIREYIWFSETRTSASLSNRTSASLSNQVPAKEEKYLLGKKDDSVYYFIYEKDRLTTLDYDALELIKTKGEQYIIYADNCLLPKDFMTRKNIIFKKIPRDITRF